MPLRGTSLLRSFLPRLLFAFLLTVSPLFSQSPPAAWPLPADFIKDDSRVLTPQTRAALSEAIVDAYESGLRVAFAATTILPHPAIALELREAWFPGDGHAVVVVYSRDMDRYFVSDAREKDPLYQGIDANIALDRANNILKELNRDLDGREPVIAGAATAYIRELARLARGEAPSAGLGDVAKTIGIWIGAAALLCLPIYLLLRSARQTRAKAGHQLSFPDVVVPPRLGALHGGITGAEIHINPHDQAEAHRDTPGQPRIHH